MGNKTHSYTQTLPDGRKFLTYIAVDQINIGNRWVDDRREWVSRETIAENVREIEIERVKLDAGGYDSTGRYFGTGAPLYAIGVEVLALSSVPTVNEGHYRSYIRAPNRSALRKALKATFPNAKISR